MSAVGHPFEDAEGVPIVPHEPRGRHARRLAEIAKFRAALAEHFITFDPADVDEKLLLDRAIAAAKEGKDFVDVEPHEFGGGFDQTEDLRIPVREILDIAGDIDGQIYMRDFKLD